MGLSTPIPMDGTYKTVAVGPRTVTFSATCDLDYVVAATGSTFDNTVPGHPYDARDGAITWSVAIGEELQLKGINGQALVTPVG